jgi:hypothetical protein
MSLPTLIGVQKPFVNRATDILECLLCLNYLICEEADNPDKVRENANIVEERVQAMRALLSQMVCASAAQAATSRNWTLTGHCDQKSDFLL